jgi:hypothetical protein
MTHSESPEQQAEQNADTKPGPASPRTEGAEAPTPPGGPLRQDDAGTSRSDGHDDDASANPAANASAEEAGGHTIPLEDEQPGAGEKKGVDEGEHELQEENAETSLDQPSQ